MNNYRKQFIMGDFQIGIDVLLMLAVFASFTYWLQPTGLVYLLVSLVVMVTMAFYTRRAKRDLKVRLKAMARMSKVLENGKSFEGFQIN